MKIGIFFIPHVECLRVSRRKSTSGGLSGVPAPLGPPLSGSKGTILTFSPDSQEKYYLIVNLQYLKFIIQLTAFGITVQARLDHRSRNDLTLTKYLQFIIYTATLPQPRKP